VAAAAPGGTPWLSSPRAVLTRGHLTLDMSATGRDGDNRAVVRAVAAADLDVAGLARHGPRNAAGKVFKGATLHP
jgi:hypothetical protein